MEVAIFTTTGREDIELNTLTTSEILAQNLPFNSDIYLEKCRVQLQVLDPNPAVWLPKIQALTRKLEAGLVKVLNDVYLNAAYLQMAKDIIDDAYAETKITEEEHTICSGVLDDTYPE